MAQKHHFDSVLEESRKFPPSKEFSRAAHIKSMGEYKKMYAESLEHPEKFWGEVANEMHWFKKWTKVLDDGEAPFYRWFANGRTNISYNCLDRHLDSPTRNKAAIVWEGEPGDVRVLTYKDLHREVCICANALKKMGIGHGDRVAIYLPMVPDLPIAMLACARIGAIHSVIFAGFSADSIKDRVLDMQAKMVITSDGGWRRGKVIPCKDIVDDALKSVDCVENVLVFKRAPGDEPYPCKLEEGRDHWYHDVIKGVSRVCPAEELDAEDVLFLLYTSGTTGKPKGIIHTIGGYMVFTYLTTKYVFDMKPEDVFWCTADIGWVTGHSYVVYGPLANGATSFIFEGAPNWPDEGRFWDIVEKYGITIFYTAPTAIRAFMKWGDEWPEKYDLSSLRLLGTVGEPINPEAWIWYHKMIGKEKCPIVDTWWQTETGGILITPLPGCVETKPGSATVPFFGVDPTILTEAGEETAAGLLAIKKPWPGMLRGIYGDPERFKSTYYGKWDGIYFAGDGAKRDADGYYWILGRVDDVVNVAGHRIGTAELESVFVEHPAVAETAVIGIKHDIKGQALAAFVSLRQSYKGSEALQKELANMIAEKIGKFAVPDRIIFAADLPKTRSGKIMRRLLRDVAEGRTLGNVTTLADAGVVEQLKQQYTED
jgi:acetyl-CoA synthetase